MIIRTEVKSNLIICKASVVEAHGSTLNRETQEAERGILPTPKGKEPMVKGTYLKPIQQTVFDLALGQVKCYRWQEYSDKSNTCPKIREVRICEGMCKPQGGEC